MHTPYHHGDLPNALRRAAEEVITEKGLGNFSLREVARRAGVSHAAPCHHFGDVRGLLTSLATEGFEVLCRVTSEAASRETDPSERLVAIGEAYVALAAQYPAHCQVMFRVDVVDQSDQRLMDAGLRAYGVLRDTVADLISSENLKVDLDNTTNLCWSAMQGLVELQPKLDHLDELLGRPAVDTRERIRRFTELILNGVRSHV